MDLEPLVCRPRDLLNAEQAEIAAAWLFGSRAPGSHKPESDVDVAILLEEEPPATLAGYHFDMIKDPVDKTV